MTVNRLNSAAAAVSFQLCSDLCNPKDSSPPGSSVHGTLQAGILERAATPSPTWGASRPGDRTRVSVSRTGGRVLYQSTTCVPSQIPVLKSCPPVPQKAAIFGNRAFKR